MFLDVVDKDKDDTDKEDVVDTDKGDVVDTGKDDAGKGDSEAGDVTSDSKEDIEVTDSDEEYIKTESLFTETVEEVIAKFSESVEVVIEEVRTVTNSGVSIAGDKSILPEGVMFEVSKIAKTTDSYKKAETKLAEKKLDGKFTVQEINLKGADGKLSFSTNHFSTYIFVEEPVAVADASAENNENSTVNVSTVANATPVESATPTALASVKTGDETDFILQMMLELAGIAFVTLAFVYGTRKKTSDSVVK